MVSNNVLIAIGLIAGLIILAIILTLGFWLFKRWRIKRKMPPIEELEKPLIIQGLLKNPEIKITELPPLPALPVPQIQPLPVQPIERRTDEDEIKRLKEEINRRERELGIIKTSIQSERTGSSDSPLQNDGSIEERRNIQKPETSEVRRTKRHSKTNWAEFID